MKLKGGVNIVYEQKSDKAPYLRIEVDENIYPLLEITSDNGTLSINNKESISPTKYNIYTNSTLLENVNGSGSINLHIKGKLETQVLDISTSGSGKIIGDSIIANSITTRVSGSGDVHLIGKTGKMESHISGSGKTNTTEMYADSVICKVSGSGNFSVYAEKYLDVSISGSGSVHYKGNPEISQSISGSGKLIKD